MRMQPTVKFALMLQVVIVRGLTRVFLLLGLHYFTLIIVLYAVGNLDA